MNSISIYRVPAGATAGLGAKGNKERNCGEGSFSVAHNVPTEASLFSVSCLQVWVSWRLQGKVLAFHPVALC